MLVRLFFDNTLNRFIQCCRRRNIKRKATSKYQDSDHLYYSRVKRDDLELEKKYLENEISITEDESLRNLLQGRLERIKTELILRTNPNESSFDKFIGIFSYSIRHNPMYKRYFNAQGLVSEDQSP